jgi:SAM-dependent methyltransferase
MYFRCSITDMPSRFEHSALALRGSGLFWAALAACGLLASGVRGAQPPAGLLLRTTDVLMLHRLCASEAENKEPLRGFRRYGFGGALVAESSILAFEENSRFTYIVADLTPRRESEPKLKDDSPRTIRRLVAVKPACFLVDDQVRRTTPGKRLAWSFQTAGTAEVSSRRIRVVEGDWEVAVQMVLPRNVQVAKTARKAGVQAGYVVDLSAEGDPDEVRFLNIVHVRQVADKSPLPLVEVAEKGGPALITVRAAEQAYQFSLPRWRDGAGHFAMLDDNGKPLAEPRPLAAGILPHSADGVAMIERWDAAYRDGRRPPWDSGRPSSDLVQAVEQGAIKPGRAVELGCGSGTNAIYLAQRDFEVTAIDLAPTALAIAERKAREAGVQVRWLLADVLAPPKLQPFDFIYDRGCYHGLRKHHAAAYVESLRRLSRPGTLVLILAGNANDPQPRSGPPRVTEEEIRSDFSKLFEILHLRETRFDSIDPKGTGALAWSVLMRRKD